MKRKLHGISVGLSIALIVIATAGTAFRVYQVRQNGLESAERSFNILSGRTTSYFLARGSFDSDFFVEQISAELKRHESVRTMAVGSKDVGTEYLFAVDVSYLPGGNFPAVDSQILPIFVSSRLFEHVLNAELKIPAFGTKNIVAVYQVLPSRILIRILRDFIIALGAITLLTFIVLMAAGSNHQPAGNVTQTRNTMDEGPEKAPEVMRTESALFSPKTNLAWNGYLEEKVSLELKRAASFDQDLSLILCGCPIGLDDEKYQKIAGHVIDFFSFQDLCFEFPQNSYAIIVPNMDLDEAITRCQAFRSRLENNIQPECMLSFGVSSRNGRLLSGGRLVNEAKNALKKAMDDAGEIIAFRVDPRKYQSYISGQTQET